MAIVEDHVGYIVDIWRCLKIKGRIIAIEIAKKIRSLKEPRRFLQENALWRRPDAMDDCFGRNAGRSQASEPRPVEEACCGNNSRASAIRASDQSRFTERGAISSISAICSTDRPPK